MSSQEIVVWVILGLFTLWCAALIKVSWVRYGFNRFFVGSFISSTIAVFLYQQSFVTKHQLGMAFFETGEDPLFGTGEDFLSGLALVVAIALLTLGMWRKFWPSSSQKNSDAEETRELTPRQK